MTQDMTDFLKDIANEHSNSPVQITIHAQSTSCAWSPQAHVGLQPAPTHDLSLLAIGTRGGSVILVRLKDDLGEQDAVEHIKTVQVSQQWITHLSWTHWEANTEKQCCATLACGMADGSICLIEVIQTLHADPDSLLGNRFTLEVQASIAATIHEADSKSITGLTWISIPSRTPFLVHFNPGLVHLWAQPDDMNMDTWSGSLCFRLQAQKTSAASSCLYPLCGISYVEKHDMLVFSLQEGSFHTMYSVSSMPTLTPPSDAFPTSESLSTMARTVFSRCEARNLRKTDVSFIGGMVSYDGNRTFAWAFETMSPSDFSYKADAQRATTFVVGEMWDSSDRDDVTHMIEKVLRQVTPRYTPFYYLRPVFLRLYYEERITDQLSRILVLLRGPYPEVPQTNLPHVHELSPDLRRELQASLSRYLFGSDALLGLRLRLSLVDLCSKHVSDSVSQEDCSVVAQDLINALIHSTLQVLVDHLSAVCDTFTQDDMPFVRRVVIRCLLPGMPLALVEAAQNLSKRATEKTAINGTGNPNDHDVEEYCPACGLVVPLTDITTATCPNGHVWSRCSITSFILSTQAVRTCVGCARKAFSPSNPSRLPRASSDVEQSNRSVSHLPAAAQSWVVEELLMATHRCLFCGNKFVSLI